jgi:hypothetical protein
MKLAGFVLIVLAACGDPSAPKITSVTPDYGPVVGGSVIVVAGAGIGEDVRVLVGGREAPLAHARDDGTIEVVIPPGDAELVVLGSLGSATAAHLFHYSTPPGIDAVSPANVVFSSSSTTVAVTGHGFLDEGAGDVSVLVDGIPGTDVVVTSDTQLTFTAPPGAALSRPDLQVIDQRGSATRSRSFRYAAGARGGLLLFLRYGSWFAAFYDPVDHSTVLIPRRGSAAETFTTVVRDERGDYWGFDRSRLFGRIDMRTQGLEAPVSSAALIPTMVRTGTGDSYMALERISRRFGTFDGGTGVFTPIGTANLRCCGSYGIATDGATLWLTSGSAPNITLATIDPVTGDLGTSVTVTGPPGMHLEELRWFGGVLYATSSNQTLLAVDPVTGVTTVVTDIPGRANAMEVTD